MFYMNKLLHIILLCLNTSISIMAQQTTEHDSFQLTTEDGYEMRVLTPPNSPKNTFVIDSSRPISGLSFTGLIVLPNNNSFVRILLQDKDGKEYLVLETSKIYNDTDTLIVSNYCEETKHLPNIYPYQLCIYTDSASINISHITLKVPNESNRTNPSELKNTYKILFERYKKEQVEVLVNNINTNNSKHNRLWRAEVTDLALLPWEERKRILGIDGRYSPIGFEYYSTGIFELGEPKDGMAKWHSNSPYVDSFDWRNRHGINWMTSVKNQRTGNGCWAFAAVGVTEALVNLYFNKKIDYNLSEQEVISCSGCGTNSSGGFENSALNWISNHGISEESSFPFSNSDEPCSNKGSFSELITMSGVTSVQNHTINNNDSVKKALIKYGPLTSGFMYNNGSYHGHSMTLVGYATLHEGDTIRYFANYNQSPNNFVVIQNGDSRIGKTYWIFKNSYGPDRYFEHKGYAYVLFNDQNCFRTPYYSRVPVVSQIYTDADIAITDNDGDGFYTWGIGQKPSNCPSWIVNLQDGDDHNYPFGPMDEYGNLYNLAEHVNDIIDITSNTLWTTKRYIYNNIVIPNGITLTIKGDVVFYNNAKISLQGGCLHIDGGHLTNALIEINEMTNSNIIISNGGVIDKSTDASFEILLGTSFQFNSGEIK